MGLFPKRQNGTPSITHKSVPTPREQSQKNVPSLNFAKLKRSRIALLGSGLGLVIIAIALTAIIAARSTASPLLAFAMSSKAKTVEARVFEKKVSIKQDEQLHIFGRYDPKNLKKVTLKFLHDGKEAFSTGEIHLSQEGTFSVSMSANVLKSNSYEVKLLNQSDRPLLTGALEVRR